MFSALRASIKSENTLNSFRSNVLSGLTVGVIALPLSMALAIAANVAPQHGLYTAIVAGIIVSISGGSRVNISGPTAAFVVVLIPIVQKFGLGGLLISGLMAGCILMIMGFAKLGRLIEIVPYPVTIGFTSGIGVVIATLQIKDFLGLPIDNLNGPFLFKVALIIQSIPHFNWHETLIGIVTLSILIFWRRTKSRIPGHLVALTIGSILAFILASLNPDFTVATIGSRFQWVEGALHGHGIPPLLPQLVWPWEQPGADGNPVGLSFSLIHSLIGSAFAIAILGAIESLLCAVVADGMSGLKHDPNDELIGQGLGNIVAPFFSGIPATAAIARTAANIRAGGTSPLSAVIHALFVLASILILAPLLSYIPMAALAALLLMVAWNMSEARHFLRILKQAPKPDIITLLTCFSLTVVFDMVIAVGVGMGLAAMMFIQRSIQMTEIKMLEKKADHPHSENLPPEIVVYDLNGPLFFGSAQKALRMITTVNPKVRVVILDMSDVFLLDMSAIIVLESIIASMHKQNVLLVINNMKPHLVKKISHAGIKQQESGILFSLNIEEAMTISQNHIEVSH